jgi:ATP-dependent Zn protease
MKEPDRFSLLWFVGAILVLVTIQVLSSQNGAGGIPYSEFKRLLAEGRVAEVTIDVGMIRGTLKEAPGGKAPAKTFSTGRVDDPGLIRALEEHGVRVRRGVFGAHMEVELVNDGPFTLVLESAGV